MQRSGRLLAIIWATLSVVAAFCAFIQFFVTYAPPHRSSPERAAEDLALMYRVTGNLAPFSQAAALMLAINAILVVWLVVRCK